MNLWVIVIILILIVLVGVMAYLYFTHTSSGDSSEAIPCTTADDCPHFEHKCIDGVCTLDDCELDEDCHGDGIFICINNKCHLSDFNCEDETDCPLDHMCGIIDDGICNPECECSQDTPKVCNPTGCIECAHRCYEIECDKLDDPDCGTDICDVANGVCVPPECNTSAECESQATTVAKCKPDVTKGVIGCFCHDHECAAKDCNTVQDCIDRYSDECDVPGSEDCYTDFELKHVYCDTTCIEQDDCHKCTFHTCMSDADCEGHPSGFDKCGTNLERDPPLYECYKSDCGKTGLILDPICTVKGEYCNLDTYLCAVPSCVLSADRGNFTNLDASVPSDCNACGADACVCVNYKCDLSNIVCGNPGDLPCPTGYNCSINHHKCHHSDCDPTHACINGEYCEDGICEDGCANDAACTTTNTEAVAKCENHICVEKCKTNKFCKDRDPGGKNIICDVSEHRCYQPECQGDTEQARDADCLKHFPSGDFPVCIDNECDVAQCSPTSTCQAGYHCSEQRCVRNECGPGGLREKCLDEKDYCADDGMCYPGVAMMREVHTFNTLQRQRYLANEMHNQWSHGNAGKQCFLVRPGSSKNVEIYNSGRGTGPGDNECLGKPECKSVVVSMFENNWAFGMRNCTTHFDQSDTSSTNISGGHSYTLVWVRDKVYVECTQGDLTNCDGDTPSCIPETNKCGCTKNIDCGTGHTCNMTTHKCQ
jgi:hypothetical protein